MVGAGGQASQPAGPRMYYFHPSGSFDDDSVLIGSWSPPPSGEPVVKIMFASTDDPKEADRWRADLRAGRLPVADEER